MGAIHFSLDAQLITALRTQLPLTHFVETGTFRGDTAVRASASFEFVYTVELSPELHAAAVERLRPYPNVRPLHGDAPRVLASLATELRDRSVAYWLDAHWCGENTAGADNECPLLAELRALGRLGDRSVVLVDDARLFLAPPPAPHDPGAWPLLLEVVDGLRAIGPAHVLWVVNDVLVFAPASCRDALVEYSRRHGVALDALVQTARAACTAQAAAGSSATPRRPEQRSADAPVGLNADVDRGRRSELLFAHHLRELGIEVVLDVGAHEGQFGSKLRQLGYAGVIYSVEPQPEPHRRLLANARPDPRWLPLARQGAGDARDVVELNVAENGWSSSVREVHANHVRAERTTRIVRREAISVNRIVDMLDPEVLRHVRAVKIDVQGYEDAVLAGLLPHVRDVELLLIELSMVECYRGGPDMFAMDARLVGELGFERVSLEPSYYDEVTGRVQQFDGIYRRAASGERQAAPRRGPQLGAVVTSVGGEMRRVAADGRDRGGEWQAACTGSWGGVAPRAISIAESPCPLPGIETILTPERPAIADILTAIEREVGGGHALLANADVAFAEPLRALVPQLDPLAVYYGNRLEVEFDPAGGAGLVAKGYYELGFDFFLLPVEFVRAVNRSGLLPPDFRIGEPWWDYLMPVLALSLGFPLKRLPHTQPLALHLSHPQRYLHERWLELGRRFVLTLESLAARRNDRAASSLTDLLAVEGELEHRLNSLSRAVCTALP